MKAMKIFLSSLGLAGLLAGCGSSAVKEYEKMVKEICDCKDMKCVEDVQKKMAEKAKEMTPKDADEAQKMAKETQPLTEKMQKCMEDLAKKGGGGGAAGGGEEKAPG
jgi:hypothetical protein